MVKMSGPRAMLCAKIVRLESICNLRATMRLLTACLVVLASTLHSKGLKIRKPVRCVPLESTEPLVLLYAHPAVQEPFQQQLELPQSCRALCARQANSVKMLEPQAMQYAKIARRESICNLRETMRLLTACLVVLASTRHSKGL